LPVNPSASSRLGAGAGAALSAAVPAATALRIGTRQIHAPGGQTLAATPLRCPSLSEPCPAERAEPVHETRFVHVVAEGAIGSLSGLMNLQRRDGTGVERKSGYVMQTSEIATQVVAVLAPAMSGGVNLAQGLPPECSGT
jgi:hypothetical protein